MGFWGDDFGGEMLEGINFGMGAGGFAPGGGGFAVGGFDGNFGGGLGGVEQLGMPFQELDINGRGLNEFGNNDGMNDWQRWNWLNGGNPGGGQMTANQAGAFAGNGFGGGLGGGMSNPFGGGGGGRGGGYPGMYGPNLRAGYGGGFGGGQNSDALLSAYMQSQNAARAANLQRYNSILGYYNKGIKGTQDLLSQYSNQDKKDINNQYNAFQGRNTQDMMTKGLGNTTVGSSVARGIETDRSGALARANDMHLNRSLQWLVPEQQAGMSFMERRNDF